MEEIFGKWTEEMGVYSSLKQAKKNTLTSVSYRNISKGQMANVWKFITKHVKSVQTVKKIRGNLELNDSSDNPAEILIKVERDMLEKEKADLINAIAKAKAALQPGQQTTFQLVKEKRKSAQDLMEVHSQISDHQQSTFLLKEFAQNGRSVAEKYSQKNKQMQNVFSSRHTPPGITKAIDTIYFTRDTGDFAKNPVLETACMRSVRESCEAIQNLLLTHETVITNRPDSFFNKKRKLIYNNIAAILEENTVSNILRCLNGLQQERINTLRTIADNLDIKNDAQNLQFSYLPYSSNSDCLQDLQPHPDVFRDIIASIIVKFMELQQINLSIKTMSARYEFIRDQLQLHLEKMFSTQPENLKLARQVIESQLEKEFAKACSEVFESFQKKLTEEVEKDCKSHQVKMSKYEDIKNMQNTIKKKQETIRTLIACNAEYDSKLENQIQAIVEFIATNIKNRSVRYTERLQTLQNCLTSEMELFGSLPLSALILVQSDGQVFLSPYLAVSDKMLLSPFVTGLCKALALTDNKPPEIILPRIISLKKHLLRTRQILKSQAELLNKLLKSYSSLGTEAECRFTPESLTELKEKLQRNWKLQVLTCGLKQQHVNLDNGFTTCRELQNVVKIWWELPAGNIILPVTVAGYDLKQYKDSLIAGDV